MRSMIRIFVVVLLGLGSLSAPAPRASAAPQSAAVNPNTTAVRENQPGLENDQPLDNAVPGLSALSPSTVAAAGPAFTLTANGSGFVSGSIVRWNGSDRSTTFLSSTQLNAAIPAADVAAGGPFAVTVFTPAPGGGSSTSVNLTLYGRQNLDVTADGVLGQPDFTTHDVNNLLLPGGANRLNYPYGLTVDPHSGRLFVADLHNHRVLSWADAAAFANSQAADLVIGQPDFTSTTPNQGGISASSLYYPSATAVDAQGNLYVADQSNSRVLIYLFPLSNGMAASQVIGQPDFVTGTSNTGGGPTAARLSFPGGLALDNGGNLYVADNANHRILEFNSPLTTDLSADRVFGQGGSFTTHDPNKGGLSANSLYYPLDATLDAQGNLYVADYGNNRVLEYDAPLASGATADHVFGQGGHFDTAVANKGGLSADSLSDPRDVGLDAQGNLYVTDYYNHRVLEYNTPLSSGATADKVFGQGSTGNVFNTNTSGANDTSLYYPTGVALDSKGNLFVADYWNNRVLEYDLPLPYGVPAVSALSPSTVAAAGPAFTLTVSGSGFVSGSVVRWNGSDRTTTYINSTILSAAILATDVAAGGPFAVRVTNPAPGGGDSPTYLNLDLYLRHNLDVNADGVLGQPNFTTNTPNNPLVPAGARLLNPTRAVVDPHSGRLFVADLVHNRVLSWPNAATFANSQPADLVIGQANVFSTLPNLGGSSPSERSLNYPFDVTVDAQGNLYVSDQKNNRVLLYTAPLSTGMAASKVFGQNGSFTTGLANNGDISRNSLSIPLGIALDAQGNLYVADSNNNRVLEYDTPLTGDTTADRVFGQGGSFTTGTPNNSGVSGNSLSTPTGVTMDAMGNLYVADYHNNRVLEYDTPLTGDPTADHVFGQVNDMSTNTPNKNGISPSSLLNPQALAVDAQGNLYVADPYNHRVLEYDTPLTGDTAADRVFGQNGAFNTQISNNGGLSAASLNYPFGVAVDAWGNLYVVDWGNQRLLEFDVPVPYGTPTLKAINPNTVVAGSPALDVTVSGSGFLAGSVVRWNGADFSTTYIDSSHLKATIPAGSIISAGTAAVVVFTPAPGGGTSGEQTFTITNPLPQLTQVNPTSIAAGSAATDLTLTGSNFVSTSVVRWNAGNLSTTYIDSSHLTVTLGANLLTVVGSGIITVFNPAPGGGESAGMSIAIIQRQLFLPLINH